MVRLPSDWTFFGLTLKYKVLLQEQIFDLVFFGKGGFTYSDVCNMPVFIRHFFIRRLQKHFDDEKKAHDKAMKQSKGKMKR